ncbi:suppressor protein SRP40-like isoform X1 [Papaver somniferum]|uniref:suppressor protein SRP40-like isoform X1 n=1 Tax=Papaver somniferum TaxID=3469 RepID=UPI000E6FA2FC|nr:suppressor protein SRP40-like isoform X1 [Papaver somniferum]
MAASAFKSTTKRGNFGTSSSNPRTSTSSTTYNNVKEEDLSSKGSLRRSRSVSALSRTSSSSSSIVDFLNKIDNPLFGSTSTSPPDLLESETLSRVAKFDPKASKFNVSVTKSDGYMDNRRGRSVVRNSECVNKYGGAPKEVSGRSLSTVDTGRRRRSVSRGRYDNSEKRVSNINSSSSEGLNRTKTPQTWSSQHPHSESACLPTEWDDGVSTSSYSEAEEKTIKAVSEHIKPVDGDHPAGEGGIYETVRFEVRRAISEIQDDLKNVIQKKNPSNITTTNVFDTPSELVNPDAVELVSEIRREYAAKFQQSQERAKKLREDLAVEEHRVKELGRILEEILPEPKSVQPQRSRPRRKNSIDRWKMSKRLTEEAMNYFDECVSISTFDSSDFSSPEDQPVVDIPADPVPHSDSNFLSSTNSSASANCSIARTLGLNKETEDQVQSTLDHQTSGLVSESSTRPPTRHQDKVYSDTTPTRNLQFSFACAQTEAVGIHSEIRGYIKKFGKEIKKDTKDRLDATSGTYHDAESLFLDERLLFDKVIFKSRIQSGGLLLCASGNSF